MECAIFTLVTSHSACLFSAGPRWFHQYSYGMLVKACVGCLHILLILKKRKKERNPMRDVAGCVKSEKSSTRDPCQHMAWLWWLRVMELVNSGRREKLWRVIWVIFLGRRPSGPFCLKRTHTHTHSYCQLLWDEGLGGERTRFPPTETIQADSLFQPCCRGACTQTVNAVQSNMKINLWHSAFGRGTCLRLESNCRINYERDTVCEGFISHWRNMSSQIMKWHNLRIQ